MEREMGSAAKRRLGDASGTGSERAKIASVAPGTAPASQGPKVPPAASGIYVARKLALTDRWEN